MASAMVSFYNKLKFAHLEAGLRSFDFNNPFPEEYNRKIASISADYHLCPTDLSKNNLLLEGIDNNKIFVVGNTVVDALDNISSDYKFINSDWKNEKLKELELFDGVVLITCHRRENQGANLMEIISGIIDLSENNPKIAFVWTLHPNPNVQQVVHHSELSVKSNVILVEPLDYYDILKLLKVSFCAISDSGGIQEEAPSFETPVIVLREATERPEGIKLGVAFLAGANKRKISDYFEILKKNSIVFSLNPYGDGKSSKGIIDSIL
jgi:UDP-N-acetylglucosamine 2-epimerase